MSDLFKLNLLHFYQILFFKNVIYSVFFNMHVAFYSHFSVFPRDSIYMHIYWKSNNVANIKMYSTKYPILFIQNTPNTKYLLIPCIYSEFLTSRLTATTGELFTPLFDKNARKNIFVN